MDDADQPAGTHNDPEFVTHVDAAKRGLLRKMVIGTAYALPAVASFSLAGLSANDAHAYVSNTPPA